MIKKLFLFFVSGLFVSCATTNSLSREPAATSRSPLFQTEHPISFGLQAAFDRVHKANAGGNWTGEDRQDEKYWSPATLTTTQPSLRKFKAKVRARGMSSANEGEATFPKLRIEIDNAEDLNGTDFKGSRNFRLNTHVETNASRTHTDMGRIIGEEGPMREALGYELAGVLDLPAPATRRAQVQYTDTDLKQTFVRKALIIETDKKFIERLGATIVEDFATSEKSADLNMAVRYHLFQILIGNADFGLRLKNEPNLATEIYRPVFNTQILQMPNKSLVPIVYDLDLATLVTGFRQQPAEPFLLRLAFLRSRLSKNQYEAGVDFLRKNQSALIAQIQKAMVDDEGRKLAQVHLQRFFQATETLKEWPMLLKAGVHFYSTSSMKTSLLRQNPVTEEEGTLRPGTAIKILQQGASAVKIQILDARPQPDLKDPTRNVGYISKSDLQTGFDLPEELQGQFDERDMTLSLD